MTPLWPDQRKIFHDNFGYFPKDREDAIAFLRRAHPGAIWDIDPFEPIEEPMEPFVNEFGIEFGIEE